MMKVDLIRYTPEGEKLIAAAARLCYSKSGVEHLEDILDEEKTKSMVEMLAGLGHASPIEHVSFTFGIEGVSRSLTHQLVRHRIASYSQQSQRYVELENFQYVIPPMIEQDPEAKACFVKTMDMIEDSYAQLVERLKKSNIQKLVDEGISEKDAKRQAEKLALEDARYVFPNACETKILVTMNARSLMNFFSLRCCNRAQWEIRELARQMLVLVKGVYPTLFKQAGPGCVYGPCPEGKMTCGKIKEVRAYYRSI